MSQLPLQYLSIEFSDSYLKVGKRDIYDSGFQTTV